MTFKPKHTLDCECCAAPIPHLRVLCDADGVLSDFVGTVLYYAYQFCGAKFQREAIDQWDCFAALGLPKSEWPRFRAACNELQLCRRMDQLPEAAAFYAELRGIAAKVRVCTSPMNAGWLTQRAEWLEEFGVPLAEQIHWHDKHELVGAYDVLIDDRAENCEAFVAAGGCAFCIATPYNTHVRTGGALKRGTHAECLAWLRGLQ